MTQYQTRAVLLAARNWGEADKLVTVFSHEYGKIPAMAFGARRIKSRLTGALQEFNVLNIVLTTTGKNMDSIQHCEILQSFPGLKDDIYRVAYGSFIAELLIELCPERQPEPRLFDLLLGILAALSNRNPRLAAMAGAWQIVTASGFQPACRTCVVCGRPLNFPAYFDPGAGGGVCKECRVGNLPVFSARASDFIIQLLALDWRNLPAFSVNKTVLCQTEELLAAFVTSQLDKPLKSLEFIKQLSSF